MIGPAGQRFAVNLRRIRITRRLSLRELEEETSKLGHRISAASLGKIENCRPTVPEPKHVRRVDVDDLLVLAAALKVRPDVLWADPGECELCSGTPPAGFICAVCCTRGIPPTA